MRGKYGVIHAAMTWSHAGRGQVLRDRQLHLPAHGPRAHLQAARQRMGKARGLAAASPRSCSPAAAARSAPKPQTLRLALPLVPTVLDPAKATRPAVAERLARALRGPDALLGDRRRAGPGRVVGRRRGRARLDVPPAQGDPLERRHADHGRGLQAAPGCARSRPSTNAPYAGPELGIVRGARHLHATGNGSIGVQVLDDRNLRVTLQHPVPWLDELAAFPVAAPVPPRPKLYSGPFRLVVSRRRQARARAELQLLERGRGQAEPARPEHGHEGRRRRAAAPARRAGAAVDRHRRAARRRAPTSCRCSRPASSGSTRAGRRSPTSARVGTSPG